MLETMTHTWIAVRMATDNVFPTSGIPGAVKRHRVPTEELEKLPRWLAWKTQAMCGAQATNNKNLHGSNTHRRS
jgi:hypothetical protein